MNPETNTNIPDFLSSDEVAEILKITPQTVYGFINDGELTAYKMNKSYRIAKRDLLAFLAQRRQGESYSLPDAALVFSTPGAQAILSATAEYLVQNLPAEQLEDISIVAYGQQISLAEYLNQLQPSFDFPDGIRP